MQIIPHDSSQFPWQGKANRNEPLAGSQTVLQLISLQLASSFAKQAILTLLLALPALFHNEGDADRSPACLTEQGTRFS